jgi:hypothetical protein
MSAMDRTAWQKLVEGVDCWMDVPRPESNDFLDLVAPLTVSSLYLAANQTYRGQCMLIFDPRMLRGRISSRQKNGRRSAVTCIDRRERSLK